MAALLGPIIMVFTFIFGLFFLIMWNRQRVKGKMLCHIAKDDKSVWSGLCELRGDFMIHEDRAYDVYPDFVRLSKFPMGWPPMLQELVPTCLYDEKDAIPLDWVHLGNRLERSMELRAALDENWIRKLVQETSTEGKGPGINFKKILPIVLIVIGIGGLLFLLLGKGCIKTPTTKAAYVPAPIAVERSI